MKTYWMEVGRDVVVVGLIVLCIVLLLGGLPVFAGEHGTHGGESPERNWELMLGPAGFLMSTYSGSDDLEIMPLPFIMGEAQFGIGEAFLKIGDGAGLAISPISSVPLKLAVGVNMGEGRDREDTGVLAGTPGIKNPVQVFGQVELKSSFGKFTTTLKYFPITADYETQADQDYTGLVTQVKWRKEWWPREFLLFEAGSGVSWMNAEYAEAQYGVASPTAKLKTFQAQSGVQDVNFSLMSILFFNEHVGLGVMGEMTYLLNDAADSPLTQQTVQPFAGLFGFYRF